MNKSKRSTVVLMGMLVLSPLIGVEPAASVPQVQVGIGFGGVVFPESWMPVRAELAPGGKPFEGTLRIRISGEATLPVAYQHDIRMSADQPVGLEWKAFFTGLENRAEASLLNTDGVMLWKKTFPVQSIRDEGFLLGMCGPPPPAISQVQKSHKLQLLPLSTAQIPQAPDQLNRLNGLLLRRPTEVTTEKAQSILRWVQEGGILIAYAETKPAFVDGAWWSGLAQPPEAKVLQQKDGVPVAFIRQLGKGRVVFFAYSGDPAHEISTLEPTAFWAGLLGLESVPDKFEDQILSMLPSLFEIPKPSRKFKTSDLLAQIPKGEGIPKHWLLAGVILLGVYAVMIGPVDYFFFRKRKALKWGWTTFFTYTLALSVAVLGCGRYSGTKASSLRLFSLMDVRGNERVDRTLGLVQSNGNATHGILAPEGTSLSPVDAELPDVLRDTMGDPTVLGAGQGAQIRLSIPVPALASRKFLAVRQERLAEPMVSCSWTDEDAGVVEVTNRSASALERTILVRQGLVYEMGTVPPQRTVRINIEDVSRIPIAQWADGLPDVQEETRKERYWNDLSGHNRLLAWTLFQKINGVLELGSVQILQSEIDLSSRLEKGATLFLGLVRENLSGIEGTAFSSVESCTVVRVVMDAHGEGTR